MRNHFRVLLLVTVSAFSSSALPQSAPDELWTNIPSCPLKVTFTPSKLFTLLRNRSSGRIVRYRLGCAVDPRDGHGYRVLRKTAWISTNMEPGKVGINLSSVYSRIGRCADSGGHLAVVEVVFQDGATWKVRK
jgi:hypothetical protein